MGAGGGNFRQAGIPADLAKEIVYLIKVHPQLGYRSLSEFARIGIIEHLRLTRMQLALEAIWATAELSADALDAMLRDSLPPAYIKILDSARPNGKPPATTPYPPHYGDKQGNRISPVSPSIRAELDKLTG